jgi:DNA polymerase delta subunit 2
MLGVSGQDMTDLYRYVDIDEPIDQTALTLRWRHIAPSAPDTLCKRAQPGAARCRARRCFLQGATRSTTRIRLCCARRRTSTLSATSLASQPKCAKVAGAVLPGAALLADALVWLPDSQVQVRIIHVPKFSETSSIALLNLRDLSCHELKINCLF